MGQPDLTFYLRRLDVGLQGKLGCRLGNALVQVAYTFGLRNLSSALVYELGGTTYHSASEPYRTRGWLASLTYLLGAR